MKLSGPAWLAPVLTMAVVLVLELLVHWVHTASGWSTVWLARLNLTQSVIAQSLLAWVFGRTLRAGHEPLIAQFARRVHGAEYNDRIAHFARLTTWAWTLFFVVMNLTAIVLYASMSLETWSFFTNVLWMPLLVLMFVLEYAARRYYLRGVKHASILQSLVLYKEQADTPRKP
jgi:uncharacterized membrane protein